MSDWNFRYEGSSDGLDDALASHNSENPALALPDYVQNFLEDVVDGSPASTEVVVVCHGSKPESESEQEEGSGPKPIVHELQVSITFR